MDTVHQILLLKCTNAYIILFNKLLTWGGFEAYWASLERGHKWNIKHDFTWRFYNRIFPKWWCYMSLWVWTPKTLAVQHTALVMWHRYLNILCCGQVNCNLQLLLTIIVKNFSLGQACTDLFSIIDIIKDIGEKHGIDVKKDHVLC